jgi:hypothetical protein
LFGGSPAFAAVIWNEMARIGNSEAKEGFSVKRSSRILTVLAIVTDVHLWVPVVVLILGTTLLMMLR